MTTEIFVLIGHSAVGVFPRFKQFANFLAQSSHWLMTTEIFVLIGHSVVGVFPRFKQFANF